MADRIIVELSENDVDRLSGRVFERIQEMMQTGEVPNYWVPQLLKIRQVADILNMPLSKIHAKVKNGEIKSLRFDDKTIRIDPRELYRYIEAHPNLKVNRDALNDVLADNRNLYAAAD